MSVPALCLEHVSYRYPDGRLAVDALDLCVDDGTCLGLVGGNGAGKSTLLLLCNGCLAPAGGSITVYGTTVCPASRDAVRRLTGTIFQDADDQVFMPTVAEDVAFGPRNRGLPPQAVQECVDAALAAVDGAHLAGRQPQQLSGGEKRRVAIAGVLALAPRLLLMDEPTANLDPHARRQFIRLLQTLPQTRIVATHDLDLVLETCPRTVLLHEGRIRADGDTRTLLADSALLERCRLEVPQALR